MDDNSLLVIILAFMLGCMCSGMMKQMCGGRLVEGKIAGRSTDCNSAFARLLSLCTEG